MSVDINSLRLEVSCDKLGLIFDADGVALFGRYADEMAAFRARKQWMEIFSNYFLLERERDYEIAISHSDSNAQFLLGCSFSSSCGRYAFWRLINHQAPEAEQKLCGNVRKANGTILSSLWKPTTHPAWILSGHTLTPAKKARGKGFLSTLIRKFRKLL